MRECVLVFKNTIEQNTGLLLLTKSYLKKKIYAHCVRYWKKQWSKKKIVYCTNPDPDTSLIIKHVSDLCFNKIYIFFLSSLLQFLKVSFWLVSLPPPFLSLSVGLLLGVTSGACVPLTACEASVLMRERMAQEIDAHTQTNKQHTQCNTIHSKPNTHTETHLSSMVHTTPTHTQHYSRQRSVRSCHSGGSVCASKLSPDSYHWCGRAASS